jgi:transposase
VNGEKLWMTATDRKRTYIIRQVLDKKITQKKAAEMLELSLRQIKRLCRRVKEEGDAGVIHKSRSRRSNHSISESIKKKVMELAKKKYKGFGPRLMNEHLRKKEGFHFSDETIRQWLITSGLSYRKRKARPHRQWRQRKAHYGEMLQMDGSHHDWLEGRGPRMVLMGFIDDATGCAFARFYEYEGTYPALDGLMRYFNKYGIPCSIYLDKHSTYRGVRRITVIDQLEGDNGESQFERAMKQLGVKVLYANSPQAKGRVERFFRTLQDRLVKEMRVAGIKTLLEANSYLDGYLIEHNSKFCVQPVQAANLHRPVTKDICLESILSMQMRRFVRNDSTIFYGGKIYQLQQKVTSRYITVEERIDGSIHLINGNISLNFQEIIKQPAYNSACRIQGVGKGNRYRKSVPQNHPWKSVSFESAQLHKAKR